MPAGVRHATTIHLTRILTYLDTQTKPSTKSEISRNTGIGIGFVDNALLFLMNHKMVRLIHTTGRWLYVIDRSEKTYTTEADLFEMKLKFSDKLIAERDRYKRI